ncbi:Hpt domain-containing protein [Echinicola sp. 20G]|uniref:Hpt domain-containing protein n=1 Tax=Echinicola sp. 20G TaxID=2781961 RepID=UPI0019101392|nr:Hpt domain-containing protein [Echinicola sp. 20G]
MYELINKDVIHQFLGDDPELIKPMLEMILHNNLPELNDLDKYFDEEQYDEVKIRCHKAKSAMGYVGSSHTQKILQEIEKDVKEVYPKKKNDLIKDIRLVEKELHQLLEDI